MAVVSDDDYSPKRSQSSSQGRKASTSSRNRKLSAASSAASRASKQRYEAHRPPRSKPWVCPHCEKAFARPSSLEEHQSSHDSSLKQQCELCGAPTSTKSNMLRHQRSKKCINGRQRYNPSESLSSPSPSPSPSLSPSSSLPRAPSAPSLVAPLAAPSRSSSEAPSLYAPTIVSPSLSTSAPLPDSSISLSPQVSPSPIDIDGDWPTPSTTSYSPLLPTPTTPRRTMPSHPSLFDPVVSDNIATTSNDFAAYAASRSLSLDMYSLPQLSSGWRDEPVSALGLEGLHFPTGVQDYTQHSTPSAGYLSLDASNAPGLVKWTLSEDIAEILASRGA